MYRGDAPSDVLLIGNSRGLIFYQPYLEKRLGIKTFNLSYNGLPANLMDVFNEGFILMYIQSPKISAH